MKDESYPPQNETFIFSTQKTQIMSYGPLLQKSKQFAIRIIRFYSFLQKEKGELVISKQILRSGTSIGANARESNNAQSAADFINKLQIALKEAAESEYWIYLLENSGYYDERFDIMKCLLDETKRMLVSTLKTTKAKE